MAPKSPTDATLLTALDDRRRLLIALYPLRRAVHRVAADCERMLESMHEASRDNWRDAVGAALLASRQLQSIVAQASDAADPLRTTQRLATVDSRIRSPQERIAAALAPLFTMVPVSPEEELLLEDARTVRDAAAGLRVAMERPDTRDDRSGGATPVTKPAGASVPRGRALVLVVDDQAPVRQVLRRHMGKLDCDVIEAENGRQALESALRHVPDLILTDMNMPEMDGMALLTALKAAASTRDVPVIVISTMGDEEFVVKCLEAGAEDHLDKPFRHLVVVARIRAVLDRKRMRDVERDYLRRVTDLTVAAEAVERGRYVQGSLNAQSAQGDALGRLARVFDRMVSGIKSKEERLQRRLGQLSKEITEPHQRVEVNATVSDYLSPFAVGEILAARYEILGVLGKGGMGVVYRAHDLELGDDVAVKVVRRDLIGDDQTVIARLKSEIRLARKLSHRNVVRLHDLGEWKGSYFISMEFVRGITVAQLLDRRGRLSVESTVAVGTQLAEALAVAHEQQIIHRDIKPANLLVDEAGVLKVMDFGIARSLARNDNITVGGFVVGTPEYMAPEQLMGGPPSVHSDLFALAVVLYECLSGRPPFIADTPTAVLARIMDSDLERLSEIVDDIPPALEELIYRQLQFQPTDRIGSARELADRLSEIEQITRPEENPLLDDVNLNSGAL